MTVRRISRRDARRWLPRRQPEANKGSVGRVYILSGSRGMTGAALLACAGAVNGGAGLVRLGLPRSQASIAAERVPLEVTVDGLPENAQGQIEGRRFPEIFKRIKKFSPDVLAVGPGLGVSASTKKLVENILAQWLGPVVLDADGLNVMAPLRSPVRWRSSVVITPHPGELGRLLGVSSKSIQANRILSARVAAQKIGGVCLLKGKDTVVTDGKSVWINTTGNAKMAGGGMGDLLTGLMAALAGQKPGRLMETALLGAYLHGLAGDMAARKIGGLSVAASKVADFIPAAVNFIRRNS